MIKQNKKNNNESGWTGTLVIFLLILALYLYYFSSIKKDDSSDIWTKFENDYLDQNVVALNTIPLLESGEIKLLEDETKIFNSGSFKIDIKRGKNAGVDKKNYAVYLFEVIDEMSPSKKYQYIVVGIPLTGSLYTYNIVFFRQKIIYG